MLNEDDHKFCWPFIWRVGVLATPPLGLLLLSSEDVINLSQGSSAAVGCHVNFLILGLAFIYHSCRGYNKNRDHAIGYGIMMAVGLACIAYGVCGIYNQFGLYAENQWSTLPGWKLGSLISAEVFNILVLTAAALFTAQLSMCAIICVGITRVAATWGLSYAISNLLNYDDPIAIANFATSVDTSLVMGGIALLKKNIEASRALAFSLFVGLNNLVAYCAVAAFPTFGEIMQPSVYLYTNLLNAVVLLTTYCRYPDDFKAAARWLIHCGNVPAEVEGAPSSKDKKIPAVHAVVVVRPYGQEIEISVYDPSVNPQSYPQPEQHYAGPGPLVH